MKNTACSPTVVRVCGWEICHRSVLSWLAAVCFYSVVFVPVLYSKDVDMAPLTHLKKVNGGRATFMGNCAVCVCVCVLEVFVEVGVGLSQHDLKSMLPASCVQ